MDKEQTGKILQELSDKIQAEWKETPEDRREFFRGMSRLQMGDVEEAAKVFRRAARSCEPPFDVMSEMARARCEVRLGRQGAAVSTFRDVATSGAPDRLRRMAWMEVSDLARERGDDELHERARSEIEQLDEKLDADEIAELDEELDDPVT